MVVPTVFNPASEARLLVLVPYYCQKQAKWLIYEIYFWWHRTVGYIIVISKKKDLKIGKKRQTLPQIFHIMSKKFKKKAGKTHKNS